MSERAWDEAVRRLVETLRPGARVHRVKALRPDGATADHTGKAIGYGEPVKVLFRDADGRERGWVLHTASANDFGHDRRADRAAEMLLAFDDFGRVPGQVAAVDVGTIDRAGRLVSLADSGEFYLITEFAPGRIYADDLRAVGARGRAVDEDLARAETLARLLVEIHAERGGRPAAWVRAVRDLLGSGEGIFGIVDGYPEETPGVPPGRLRALERRCLEWRWRLRGRSDRLVRTHGDFHPFNIVFDEAGRPALLDASRGCRGEAADDVTALAINYVFFALDHPAAWRDGFRPLWRRFLGDYLDATGDAELLEVAPPFFAWRALVVANPVWYPDLPAGVRDAILSLAERALDAGRLDLAAPDALFP